MDKKQKIIGIIALAVLIIIVIISVLMDNDKKEHYIKDSNYLYDLAIEYLKEKAYQNPDSGKDYFHFFVKYDGLGITEKDNQKFAYLWVLGEEYYYEDNEIKDGSGYSMFYKFIFEDDKIVNVEDPEDGSHYTESVKKMCPDTKMSNKVLDHAFNLSNDKEVKEYYEKVLDSNNLEKDDIIGNNNLLFNISWKKSKCIPVNLVVYDNGKYELYTSYEACKKGETCDLMLKYTKVETGTYDYDVMEIIKNSKNADYLMFTKDKLPEYEIYTGKNDYVYMMVTDSNNNALTEFLKSINVNLHTCATPDYSK